MTELVKGTTPTIRYNFSSVTVSDIVVALLKITQAKGVQVVKDLEDATVGNKYLEWVLTQEETLSLKEGNYALITLDWLLDNGTRGFGKQSVVKVVPSGTNEVLEVSVDE